MKILAVDTALQAASACVLDGETGEFEALESLPMERGHAEALMPLIERICARVEGGFPALSRVGVTVGPGSFTGLRVGLAAARAIGLACDIPVVGVSTLAALAAPLIVERRPEIVAAVVDARHGAVYYAGFEPGGRALSLPRILPAAEAAAEIALAEAALRRHGGDPEAGALVRLAGSGAGLVLRELERRGVGAEAAGENAPDIRFVARLALAAEPALAPPRPLYLKPADAKPQAPSVFVAAPEAAGEAEGANP